MENNKTPSIRFKGFTDPWEQRKLGEIGSVSMCRRIFKEQTSETGDIPFYKIGTFGAEPDAFISRELFEEYKSKYPYPKKGDILISASGSIGRTVEFAGNNEYFQDSNIVWLSHDERLSNPFLKCFYSVVKWAGIEGSTIKRLYNDNILNTVICMPSVPEQDRIGAFFENLDNLITLHQRKYNKLLNVKKSMLEKMFPKNESNIPEIRFKGFTDPWEQRKLTEFVEFFSGLTYTPNDVQKNGTLVLRSSNVSNGEVVDADNVYVNPQVVNSENVKVGDIVVVVRNGSRSLIGKHAQIKAIMPNTVIGAFMTGIRSECPAFTNALLNTSRFEEEIAMNMGATINQITGYMFSKMEFKVPCLDEQKKIGGYFEKLDNLITLHQRELEKLQNIKKSMLEKMFV